MTGFSSGRQNGLLHPPSFSILSMRTNSIFVRGVPPVVPCSAYRFAGRIFRLGRDSTSELAATHLVAGVYRTSGDRRLSDDGPTRDRLVWDDRATGHRLVGDKRTTRNWLVGDDGTDNDVLTTCFEGCDDGLLQVPDFERGLVPVDEK